MQRVSPLRNSLVVDERRRHPRHKPTSIIYAALGPGNGGILVNLSVGGASLQAAAKLNPDTELALDFQLRSGEKPIQTVGHVAWLDPSQKEAGISFKDLPANTERQIAEWIASQEQPTWNPPTQTKPQPISGAKTEPLRLPTQASIPAIFPSEKPESTRQSLPPVLRGPIPEFPEETDVANEPHAMPPPPASVPPALVFPSRSEAQVESPAETHIESPAKHLFLKPTGLRVGERDILPRDTVLPAATPLRPEVLSPDPLAPAKPDSSASDLRRRRKLGIGLAAAMMVLIGLIVTATSFNRQPVADSSSVGAVEPSLSPAAPAAVLPEKAPQTKPAAKTRHGVRAAPSATASTGADADAPAPVVRVAIGPPVKQDSGLMGSLKALLGMEAPITIDAKTAALPVWTVRHSGFYYCVHSPDFRTLEPGAIMTQGQALQSGYQPKLGSYCQ